LLIFTKDVAFSSPSAAAVVIHGGNANGLTAWISRDGKSLKQLDEQTYRAVDRPLLAVSDR
jgi:hypothetical protein